MAVVSFEQIRQVHTGQVQAIDQPEAALPAGPIDSGTGQRPTLYDPTWGYFLFGQRMGFEYSEADAYASRAQFTIEGTFTAAAEAAVAGAVLPTEQEQFDRLVAKLEALEGMFAARAGQEPPVNVEQWFTELDPRILWLPEPLRDKAGNRVAAMPGSIEVEKTRFPVEIRYRATLLEAKLPPVKLLVNDVPIDVGTVTITPPNPKLHRHRLVAAEGAVVQIGGYGSLRLHVRGRVPNPARPDKLLSDSTRVLAQQMTEGRVSIRVAEPGEAGLKKSTVWDKVLVQGPSVEVVPEDGGVAVAFTAVR